MSTPAYEVTLTKEDQQYAITTLYEPQDEEEKRKTIADIREWIDKNKNLKVRDDDKNIIRFLRSCKYRPEHTRNKITNYYELKVKELGWFRKRDPQDPMLLELMKSGVFVPLRGRDQGGRTVVLIRTAVHDPKTQSVMDVFKVGKMFVDLMLELDETISVFGIQVILDLSGNTIGHVLQLTPSLVSRAVHSWQNAYPVRVRSMDFFNAPIYVHVLGSDEARLHEVVDRSLLPVEYGGTAGTLQELIDFWVNRMIEHRDWFLTDEKDFFESEI